MCLFFRRDKKGERAIKIAAIVSSMIPGIWAIVDLAKGKTDDGLIKLMFLVVSIGQYTFGYIIGDLKSKNICNLPHTAQNMIVHDSQIEGEGESRSSEEKNIELPKLQKG